jgi:hypothetical protein
MTDVRAQFERCLRECALKGKGIPTETDLSAETYTALMDVARAWPGASPSLIALARNALEVQLSDNRAWFMKKPHTKPYH